MHLLSFLRGMAFGGVLVYLFAPRSGVETRRMLAERGNDLKKLVADDMLDLTGESEHESGTVVIASGTSKSSGNIYDPTTLADL